MKQLEEAFLITLLLIFSFVKYHHCILGFNQLFRGSLLNNRLLKMTTYLKEPINLKDIDQVHKLKIKSTQSKEILQEMKEHLLKKILIKK